MNGRWWRRAGGRAPREGRCGTCAHFDNTPETLEAEFGNLAAMSSGFASVRADDGICGARGIYLAAGGSCAAHTRRQSAG